MKKFRFIKMLFPITCITLLSGCSFNTSINEPSFFAYGDQVSFNTFKAKYNELAIKVLDDYFLSSPKGGYYAELKDNTKVDYRAYEYQKVYVNKEDYNLYGVGENHFQCDPKGGNFFCNKEMKVYADGDLGDSRIVIGQMYSIYEQNILGRETQINGKTYTYGEVVGDSIYYADVTSQAYAKVKTDVSLSYFALLTTLIINAFSSFINPTNYEQANAQYYINNNILTIVSTTSYGSSLARTTTSKGQLVFSDRLIAKTSSNTTTPSQVIYKSFSETSIFKTKDSISRVNYSNYNQVSI